MRPSLAWQLIKNAWMRSFIFRSDIIFFRAWDIFMPLSQILVWRAVFSTTEAFAGYSRATMLSYVLVSTLFIALSRNWMVQNVGEDIKEGMLNVYLTKPVSYVAYTFWFGIGRTLIATCFALLAVILLAFAFRGELYIPDVARLGLSFFIAILAFVLNMLISIALGLVAFWIIAIEGFAAATIVVRQFFSGGLFPLDIVAPWFVLLSRGLPFAYSGFIPTQVFLGKMSLADGLVSLLIELAWVVALVGIIKLEWRWGIKKYEGVGI